MPKPTPSRPDGREIRAITVPLEMRAAAEGETGRTATGYAAVFGVETSVGGYWTEVIAPGAFTASLTKRDVIAVHTHDTGRVLGRLRAGTLSLREDAKGLAFENLLPDTTDGRDLAVQIDRGDIAGMSFGFVATREEWNDLVEPPKRTILECDLYEITYTPLPQYPDTEVGMRSLDAARNERRSMPPKSTATVTRRARQAQAERGL
ncbi:HK97 family phage prohead protease [Sphingomonas sp. VNH70]|uniref:HK97 family phage prohead protease n=1 Tax=Sphingomonas silueang TaxID=3156617 RepID=UPI0032B5C679